VLLGIDALSRSRAAPEQIALVREVLGACSQDPPDPAVVASYRKRLQAAGVEVMPTVPGASVVLVPDDAGDSAVDGAVRVSEAGAAEG
jgi:hypothetical protein